MHTQNEIDTSTDINMLTIKRIKNINVMLTIVGFNEDKTLTTDL